MKTFLNLSTYAASALLMTVSTISCSTNSATNDIKKPEESVEFFAVPQSFSSTVRRSIAHAGNLYTLVLTEDNPHGKIGSQILKHSQNGTFLLSIKPNIDTEVIIDFDIDKIGGALTFLSLTQVQILNSGSGLSLKELKITTILPDSSRRSFIFKDPQQHQAVTYLENGTKIESIPFDSNRTLFLTSSFLTEVARVKIVESKIYLSAVGRFGYKVFVYDLDGHERWQQGIVPLSVFNTISVDEEAAVIDLQSDKLIVAIDVQREEKSLFESHFGIFPSWPIDQKRSVMVQRFAPFDEARQAQVFQFSANIFLPSLSVGDGVLALTGSIGGAGDRKAGVLLARQDDLSPIFKTEYSIYKETTSRAIYVVSKDEVLLGGDFGTFQVGSGSVVEPGDAFFMKLNSKGEILYQSLFGEERHDTVTTIAYDPSGSIFLGGYLQGPITHTADLNPNLGFNKLLLGRLVK